MRDDILRLLGGHTGGGRGLSPPPRFTGRAEVRERFADIAADVVRGIEAARAPLQEKELIALVHKLAAHCQRAGWQDARSIEELTHAAPRIIDAVIAKPRMLTDRVNVGGMLKGHFARTSQHAASLAESIGADGKPPAVLLGLPGGCTLVELATPGQLEAESRTLGHCLGTLFNRRALAAKGLKPGDAGASRYLHYAIRIRAGACRIFSLRNRLARPLATIEYDAKSEAIRKIEGRSGDAEDGFGRIFSSEREELLKEVARGYLGLVHHIKGRLDVAERLYEESIGALVAMDRFRPVSILKRHYGDMLRLVGRFEDAEREYRAAERGATAGGNMDLVHMAQVTMARLRFAQGIVDDTARRLLDEATAYADTMELPRLKAESLFARGEALLHSGETTLAGDFAVRALRIATLNGLALRKAAYAELTVRIYRARGDDHAADVLLAKTVKAARGQGYNVLINRIASASHGSTRTTRAAPAHSAAAGTTGSVVPQASNSKGQRG